MGKAEDMIEQIKAQEKKGFVSKRNIKKTMPTQKSYLENYGSHIKNALEITGEFKMLENFGKCIICGVGTAQAAGQVLASYINNIEIQVNSDFNIKGLRKDNLVVIASYNGNDEEAIACYKQCLRTGVKIIGLTSGGRLLDGFERNSTEHIVIPKNLIESTTFHYFFFPLLRIFENSRLIHSEKEAINEVINATKKTEIKDLARGLYEKIQDKMILIYATKSMGPVADYWKLQINLNAKAPAFSGVMSSSISELNTFVKDIWDFYIVFLKDEEDSIESQKAIKIAKEIVRNKGYGTTEIILKGTNPLTRIISSLLIADYVSYFLSGYYNLHENLVEKYKENYTKKN